MNNSSTKEMRKSISKYAKPSNKLAALIFLADLSMYMFSILGVIMLENIYLRIALAIFAGLKIGTLFLVSHDSAHDSFTTSRLCNKVLGRVAFLPSFHNFSLWLIAHNRSHHQSPNVKGLNSWTPLSKHEFDALPKWRQLLERLYRSPFGISFNYMVERWWKDKFFPYNRIVEKRELVHWIDFYLVSGYLLLFASMLIVMGFSLSHTNPLELIVLALGIPFLISNFLIGNTIYQHHTHETLPWFRTVDESKYYVNQEDVTMNVQYPDWYNVISNNSMIHTVHHVDPRIPLYYSAKAQKVLYELHGDKMISTKFSLRSYLSTMNKCKLYDYDNHIWLDFYGNATSEVTFIPDEIEYAEAA